MSTLYSSQALGIFNNRPARQAISYYEIVRNISLTHCMKSIVLVKQLLVLFCVLIRTYECAFKNIFPFLLQYITYMVNFGLHQLENQPFYVYAKKVYEPPREKTYNLHMQNKDADQLRGDREADQCLCFRYTDSTCPILLKSEISSF